MQRISCRTTKKLLFTGYIDGEISAELKTLVEDHLAFCPVCRRLGEDLTETMAVFKGNYREQAPDTVWRGIKDRIGKKVPRSQPVFIFPRVVWLTAALGILFLAILIAAPLPTGKAPDIDGYLLEDIRFWGMMETGESALTGDEFQVDSFLEKLIFGKETFL